MTEGVGRMSIRRRIAWLAGLFALVVLIAPESPVMPVVGATARDWNAKSFWYEPWGRSGVHKGIDVFARAGTPIVSPTYGLVVFRGDIAMGGRVVAVLGPKLRVHYFAHLQSYSVRPGQIVRTGTPVGRVGDTGNALGKPPHLHFSVVTLLPYPWRIDGATQGWKKMFYLDPASVLGWR